MKIRIKAGSVEIEYEESTDGSTYYFMLGKGKDKDGNSFKDKHMECLKGLIDGVDQLLQAQQITRD